MRESPEGFSYLREIGSGLSEIRCGIIFKNATIGYPSFSAHFFRREIQTEDGYSLSYRLIGSPDARMLVILIPGLFGIWENFSLLIPILIRENFLVCAFDARGYRENKMVPLGFGYCEQIDVISLINEIEKNFSGHYSCACVGYSMGATGALLSAVNSNKIRVVITEGSFKNASDGLGFLPAAYNQRIADVVASYKIAPEDISPIDIAERWPGKPLLMSWGERDHVVSLNTAKKLSEVFRARALPFESIVLTRATHIIQLGFPLSFDAISSYNEKLVSFLKSNLKNE